jgi:hypothetical protein
MKRNTAITAPMLKKIKSFWRYWAANKSKIQEVLKTQEDKEDIFLPLIKKLNSISRRIGYKLETHKISGKTKITFTAHGCKILFPKIIALAGNFPMIPAFSFQAFIQPTEDLEKYKQGTDHPLVFSDFTLKISEMKFLILQYNTDRKKLKIKVLLPNFRYHYDNPILYSIVIVLLEELVGELPYHKYIQLCNLEQVPDNFQKGIPLYQLTEYINRLKTTKTSSRRII